jgi:protein-tyrosine sulfotransferase
MALPPGGVNGKSQAVPGLTGALAGLAALDEPVIVLTAARSGSTLLRRILDAHPDLACPPETNIVRACASLAAIWEMMDPGCAGDQLSEAATASIRAVVDGVFGSYLLRRGKRRWCEKSLGSVLGVEPFPGLYPKAKFICLYRHCMDMIDSALEATPWGLNGYGFENVTARFPGNSVAALAGYWLELISAQLQFEEQHKDRCHRVYYEELVSDPEHVSAEIFSFIGVDDAPGIAEHCLEGQPIEAGPGDHKIMATSRISADSVGRGMRIPVGRLPPGQLQLVNDLLGRLGYALVDDDWANCPRLPVVLPGRAAPTAADDAGPAAQLLASIDQTLRERIGPRLNLPVMTGCEASLGELKRIGIVAYCGAAEEARYWELDLGEAELRADVYTGLDDLRVDWLLTGDAGTWSAVLAGEQNLAACIRSRALRYIEFSAGEDDPPGVDQQLVSDRMNIITALLDRRSGAGGRGRAEHALATRS